MMKRIGAALAAVFIAAAVTSCGTISPPIQTTTTTTAAAPDTVTTVTTLPPAESEAETVTSAEESKPELTEEEKRQIEQNTFIAEFFDSQITFGETKAISEEALKTTSFEHESENNGIEKITLKSKNGNGSVDVMVIDLSNSSLSYDLDYILETFGDYYYGITVGSMEGVNTDDFSSNYRMTSSVVSKGRYERTGSVQKSDGMANQFGYTETYAVLKDNKLTVVSGQFLSTDMMERQSFTGLMQSLSEKVEY